MVLLEPMSEELFHKYLRMSLKTYAEEHVKAGNWGESTSIQRAEEQIKELLPLGIQTEGHHFLRIFEEITKEEVGVIWFSEVENENDRNVFLYDLNVDEQYRSQGYGKQAMYALEQRIAELGATSIYLHVFAHNKIAKSLYDGLGYEIVKTYYDDINNRATSFRMAKTVAITK